MGIERLSGVLTEIGSWDEGVNVQSAAWSLYNLEVALIEATTGNSEDIRALGIVYENWRTFTRDGAREMRRRDNHLVKRFDNSVLAISGLKAGENFEHRLICTNYKTSVLLSRDTEGCFSASLMKASVKRE